MAVKIGEKSKIYIKSMESWSLPIALMGGLQAMKDCCGWTLPKYGTETPESHGVRVKLSSLYNVFRRTVKNLGSKPFSKPIKILKMPTELKVLEKDVDRDGLTLTQFGREMTANILTFGLTHVLVDNPVFDPERLTKAAAKELNIHPYFVHVRPDNLIWWNYVRGVTGENVLDEIHFFEEETDENNEEWEVIHVWRRDAIQLWRKRKHKQGPADEEYQNFSDLPNMLGVVPLVTVYADLSKRGLMVADSPLDDLANLNLRHYRSQSDQDTCLHFARVPFLHFAGFQKEEIGKTVAVNNAYTSINPTSKITWVETTGHGLEQGNKDLEAIEARMDVMGADLLVKKPGNPTATAKAIDAAEKISDLQAIALSIEDGLAQAFHFAAMWVDDPNAEIELEVFKNFGLSMKDKSELDTLLKARVAGEISRETWLTEIQRRGLTDEFDVEEEMNRLNIEGKEDKAKLDDPVPQPTPAE